MLKGTRLHWLFFLHRTIRICCLYIRAEDFPKKLFISRITTFYNKQTFSAFMSFSSLSITGRIFILKYAYLLSNFNGLARYKSLPRRLIFQVDRNISQLKLLQKTTASVQCLNGHRRRMLNKVDPVFQSVCIIGIPSIKEKTNVQLVTN